MLRAAFVAIVLCPLVGLPAPALSQQQWVLLGTRQLSSGGERDIIRSTSDGRFKRIRLVVQGGDLELFDLRVTFADGTTFSPSGRFTFTGNSRARVIALPGAPRVIRWVNFFYRSLPSGRQPGATVHAYGRR